MRSWHFGLGIVAVGVLGCSSGSGSGGGVGGVDSGTGATGGSTSGGTGGTSGNGGTPTGGSGGASGGSGGAAGASGGAAGASGSGGTAGSSGECQTAGDCPGVDTECNTRTCINQTCGNQPTNAGFVVSTQTAGDCTKQVCDGAGQIVGQADATDIQNDANDCTVDSCAGTSPQHTPKTPGSSCTGAAGAKVCNSVPACVECIAPGDCASGVCTPAFTCAANSCTDTVKNGSETDVDCGGGACPKCQVGQGCGTPSDCATNVCGTNAKCSCNSVQNSLLLSEVRWRGLASASDEFVELYNPGNTPVTVTSAWTLEFRSETAATYSLRFTGSNQVVPPHGHLLIVGSVYTGPPTGDANLTTGVADEGSLVLKNNGNVVDAVCWNCGANSFTTQVCEGGQVAVVGCTSAGDKSVERKVGGSAGNCVDTNATDDWQVITPSAPQSLSSPPTP